MEEFKQAIVVRTDLKMGKGKIASQVAHASLHAYEEAMKKNPDWVNKWKKEGSKKVVLKVKSRAELLELYNKIPKELPKALITDAGRTQLKGATLTCFAVGPAPEKQIDKFTSHLKLL